MMPKGYHGVFMAAIICIIPYLRESLDRLVILKQAY
jgi:hypothetical protein